MLLLTVENTVVTRKSVVMVVVGLPAEFTSVAVVGDSLSDATVNLGTVNLGTPSELADVLIGCIAWVTTGTVTLGSARQRPSESAVSTVGVASLCVRVFVLTTPLASSDSVGVPDVTLVSMTPDPSDAAVDSGTVVTVSDGLREVLALVILEPVTGEPLELLVPEENVLVLVGELVEVLDLVMVVLMSGNAVDVVVWGESVLIPIGTLMEVLDLVMLVLMSANALEFIAWAKTVPVLLANLKGV